MKKLKAQGIPTVAVFLSGRPLWVNPELNASDAFVAAWLPGSEGGGVADVLVGDAQGRPRHDFTGKLSFSWPKTAAGAPLNRGDRPYDPLFAYGYGLTYADHAPWRALSEDPGVVSAPVAGDIFFTAGREVAPWRLTAEPARPLAARSIPEHVTPSPHSHRGRPAMRLKIVVAGFEVRPLAEPPRIFVPFHRVSRHPERKDMHR